MQFHLNVKDTQRLRQVVKLEAQQRNRFRQSKQKKTVKARKTC